MDAFRSISVVLPAYNEATNLRFVVAELSEVLARITDNFEILVVDDGSNDETQQELATLMEEFPQLWGARFRSNRGKSAAVQTGLELVSGDTILLMDADGQDDAQAIPELLATLDNGIDMVTGSRVHNRHDRFIKRSTSRVYNWASRHLTGLDVRDMNSGFKAMNSAVAGDIMVYGELHRYLPVLATWAGYRVAEVSVTHRERHSGESKFGLARFWRGLLDLLTVRFLSAYTTRPFHLFGGLGFVSGLVGAGLLAWMLLTQIFSDSAIGSRPALTAGVLFVLLSIQLFSVGLVGELIVNTSQRSQRRVLAEMASLHGTRAHSIHGAVGSDGSAGKSIGQARRIGGVDIRMPARPISLGAGFGSQPGLVGVDEGHNRR